VWEDENPGHICSKSELDSCDGHLLCKVGFLKPMESRKVRNRGKTGRSSRDDLAPEAEGVRNRPQETPRSAEANHGSLERNTSRLFLPQRQ